MFGLVPLVLLFPALGAGINLAFGRKLHAGVIGSGAAVLAFSVALLQFVALLTEPTGTVIRLFTWIEGAGLHVDWALRVDTLSVTMMLVVTGVGALIHVYAIGYMRGDERYARFFAYLNLFLVAMLVLVAADNFLMLFVGWEGVGLCSFLLIGFWFDQPHGVSWRNSNAARKAFLVNRVGDAGFIIALLIIGTTCGSFDYAVVFNGEQFLPGDPLVVALTLCLLIGCAAKSAQIPLCVWLPDAMAGPTPVSALIHAATMVTAGVYLITRAHTLFELAPLTQAVIAAVGALTALLAASAAIAQYDIKRVLAYSTISQLGFMMVAVGLGAYTAAIFHLVTHAFFKALLFLAAGSVVHALGHGNDMRMMGGLRRHLPTTFATYGIGALSLAGIPPLAAFFSKDDILSAAWTAQPLVGLALLGAAGLTAFYIGRQALIVFFGAPRSRPAEHAHESPRLITLPLIGLAALAVIGGALNWPGHGALGTWLGHTLGEVHEAAFNPMVALLSVGISGIGLGAAYLIYGRQPLPENRCDPLEGRTFDLLARGWGLNDLYAQVFVRGFNSVGAWLKHADESGFASLETGVLTSTDRSASVLERTETRQINWNIAAIIGGLALLLTLTLWLGGR